MTSPVTRRYRKRSATRSVTLADVAAAAGVSAQTARRRVSALRASGALFFDVEIDDALFGVFTVSQIVRGAFQSAYLGYYGHQRYAGQGYMGAALEQVLDHVFGTLALHRVEANIQPGNAPSAALAKGAGFRLEGFSPRYLLIGGRWRDHERYAITFEERPRS